LVVRFKERTQTERWQRDRDDKKDADE
jgi:hypothetical protein